jgi:hypothetical protein
MEFLVWINFTLLFLAGGLTPGPAVMLVTTSSIRYGFWPSMVPAVGICVANLVWIALAASGVAVLAKAFPEAFLLFKLAGIAFIVWLAWRTAFGAPVDLLRREPPPRRKLFVHGIGLQLANPNALVYFGGLLPTYFNPEHDHHPADRDQHGDGNRLRDVRAHRLRRRGRRAGAPLPVAGILTLVLPHRRAGDGDLSQLRRLSHLDRDRAVEHRAEKCVAVFGKAMRKPETKAKL